MSRECDHSAWQEEPLRTALLMAGMLDDFPRYAKMHPCGVVLSRDPIRSLTPTFVSGKGWPTTHFDMDAVEAVGLIKLDILAQGGLAVLRDTQTAIGSTEYRGSVVECGDRDARAKPRIVGTAFDGRTGFRTPVDARRRRRRCRSRRECRRAAA